MRKRIGFTLFELVVALAVTSVIAVFVFGFAVSLTDLWNRSQNSIDTELDASVALDAIATDLESAVFVEGNGVMLAVTVQDYDQRDDSDVWDDPSVGSGRLSENDFAPNNHTYGWAGSWVRFFTASPGLNAVSYQVIRRPTFTDSDMPRYVLYRSVVRQDHTLEAGFDITLGDYNDGPAFEFYPGTVRKPAISDYLIENVVDFGVRLYVYDSDFDSSDDAPKGLRLVFPADNSSLVDSNDRLHLASTGDSGAPYGNRFPDVAEIFIRVVDNVGAAKLLDIEENGAPGTFEEVVAQHGRVYERMVRVVSSSY